MLDEPDREDEGTPAPAPDPRLTIPEVLRQPAKLPDYDPVVGTKEARAEAHDVAGMGRAWAMALDFVFSVLAGALIGWLADRWRGSLPLWTLVGLGLGFATGLIRIVQATRRQEAAEQKRRSGG
jgi:ATP synthase protein I